ncbi:hypothetical protein [Streptomyces sp. Agncl-13]
MSRAGESATARVLDADLSGRLPYVDGELVPGPTIREIPTPLVHR